MKIALFIVSVALVMVSIILAVKSRKWSKKEDQQTRFEITPGDVPLDKHVLVELGFKIYETKDQTYALSTTGISMTWVENMEWVAEVINSNKTWKAHVYHVSDLAKFAQLHGKELRVTDKN